MVAGCGWAAKAIYPMQLSAGVSQSLAGRNYALYEPAKAIHSRGGTGIGKRRGRSNRMVNLALSRANGRLPTRPEKCILPESSAAAAASRFA